MRLLLASGVAAILLAGFATPVFAAQVAKTKTTQTVKSNQPPARVTAPGLKSNSKDNLSDSSQEQQLKMQMEMGKMGKADTAASNIMKKRGDTANEIINNMK